MKTIKAVIEDNKGYQKLIKAVVSKVGKDSIQDINRVGMSAGFGGLIYYSDTHKFAMFYRKQIIELLEEQADQLGEDVVKMVSQFGIFRNNPMDNDDKKDLYRYLGGAKVEQGTITNIMAWFAAEEVCRMFED